MEDRRARIIQQWQISPVLTAEEQHELETYDAKTLQDAFHGDIAFGTGGARGLMGIGTNRLNRFTIAKLSYGLGLYLKKKYTKPVIVIAYDNRHQSQAFSLVAQQVFAHLGIRVFFFEQLMPTPLLSYAVRYLGAHAGVMVTASHNTKEYNGYKVYNQHGSQLLPDEVEQLLPYIDEAGDALQLFYDSLHAEMQPVSSECVQTYIDLVKGLLSKRGAGIYQNIAIGYSPQHGTGSQIMPQLFAACGFKNITFAREQMVHDGDFSATRSANPENPLAFELLIEYGKQNKLDVLLTTDPDADRLGVAIFHKEQYQLLTGNQLGAIIIQYLCENGLHDGFVVKTIVTSELGAQIARKHGLEVIETLTGFKYIGASIEANKTQFRFGYEESYGYLLGDFVRDKDAMQMSVIVAEIVAFYKSQGKDLIEVLDAIFVEYGYYAESLHAVQLDGPLGEVIYEQFCSLSMQVCESAHIAYVDNYQTGFRIAVATGEKIPLIADQSLVLKYTYTDGSWFCIRPSGTEPQLKVYVSAHADTSTKVKENVKQIEVFIESNSNGFLFLS